MDDLISRQAAIEALQKEIDKVIPPFDDVIGSIRAGVRLARNIIEDLPSAQQEIIRCRDCVHYHEEVWGKFLGREDIPLIVGHQMCDFWGEGCKTKDDGFCFAAKREDDA